MQPQSLLIVDAFTGRPFAGNPAAVCILSEPATDVWMQAVATEMNLSETAFLTPSADGFDLRWFTPVSEVDLCGHATLASAHCLWHTGYLARTELARFYTRSGLLTATRQVIDGETWIELDFPAEIFSPAAPPAGLEEALKACPVFVGRNRMDYVVELPSEDDVRKLQPDIRALSTIEARGVVVTARGTGQADIVSRCFYPRQGIDEDPVTGSAHCGLAPYWSKRLGKTEMLAYQASARGGWLRIRDEGDRVKLTGQAVITLVGELTMTEMS